MTSSASIVVPPESAGERLDSFLASRPEVGSRAAAQRLIAAGAVAVAGKAAPKSHRVAAGAVITVAASAREEGTDPAEPDVPFEVVYEDDALIVVDKPAGLVVHPAAGHRTGTLAQALGARAGGGPAWRPGIVHRLDKDTSGLMVVAKSEAVLHDLQELIQERELTRVYLTLVSGRVGAASGTIDAPIGRDPEQRTQQAVGGGGAREARTHFELLDQFARTALLKVHLETGRTHQVRVHLAAIGHPVCGDQRYGGVASGRRLGLKRQFLHSAELMFRHPVSGENVLCESKPPAELRRSLDAARREPAFGGPDEG